MRPAVLALVLASSLSFCDPATNLLAQAPAAPPTANQGRPPGGLDREAMWYAPTAEDWKKPCLVTWQRSWDDALAVSKESSRPILICVNMDGEIASEHYAGVRYRQPDIAKLYEPYVCVIASVYRHTPRDYDEDGKRIECPRFGGVTCGEHIAIEPLLYDQFFDGKRIAPRHIMIEQGASESYDVYYAFDTESVFRKIEEGITQRPPPPPIAKGDRSIFDRVASRDVFDRAAIEAAYEAGNAETKEALLAAASKVPDSAPVEMLRLAVFGKDAKQSTRSLKVLADTQDAAAVELIGDALRLPMDAKDREALVGALDRLSSASPRAATLAAVHRGLASRSTAIDVESWSEALSSADAAPLPDPAILEYRMANQSATITGTDPNAKLDLAESCLERSRDIELEKKFQKLLWQDARQLADDAERLGASGARLDSIIALSAWFLGDVDESHRRAEMAVKNILLDPALASGETGFGVLQLFAHARRQQIVKAMRAKTKWPAEWLTDLHSTYGVMARHPLGTDVQIGAHIDFLRWLGGHGQANDMLDVGLERFPESWGLHERFRARVLARSGAEGLEPAYERLLAEHADWPNLMWFAGYASIVYAEHLRRVGLIDESIAAYDRAIARYDAQAAAHPETRENSDHYAAVALGAKARVELERKQLDRATDLLIASFDRCAAAAQTLDGLNLSSSDTSRTLRARLVDAKRDDLLTRLEERLSKLDPELLKLPAYERPPR